MTDFARSTLFAIVLAPSMALATALPAMAADKGAETVETKVEETKTAMAMGGMHGMYGMRGTPKLSYDGGTAIINFVAGVEDDTMADLAMTAQNAVIGGAEAIRINISSQGGSVYAMQFAVNVLGSLSVPVETVAMSHIASAAVALFCAGDKRYMAEGATLYLHQQSGYAEIQDKTAAALVRSHRLSSQWYEDLVHACTDDGSDRSLLDYSSRDVVIDRNQARELGMVTAEMEDLPKGKVWGSAMNILSAAPPMGFGFGSPMRGARGR